MPRLSALDLERATFLAAQKQVELTSRGLNPTAVAAGIARAWGAAEFHTRALSPGIRGQAFLETLIYEFREIEGWARNWVKGMAR